MKREKETRSRRLISIGIQKKKKAADNIWFTYAGHVWVRAQAGVTVGDSRDNSKQMSF